LYTSHNTDTHRGCRKIASSDRKEARRGFVALAERPAPQLMGSIQPPERQDRVLESIARGVAFERRLPWRLAELREEAAKAYDTAEPPPASLGLPLEQVSRSMLRQIYEQVKNAAGRMDPLPPDQSQPTPSQIDAALEAFSSKQWTPVERFPPMGLSSPMEGWPIIEARFGLMQSVGRAEVEALLHHIRQVKGDLARRIGARKLEAIEGVAISRQIELSLPEERTKLVAISDVYWSLLWRVQASEANRQRRGLPARGRSVIEQASDRNLAKRLSKSDAKTGRALTVTPYEVRMWRERMAKLSFEQFAAEVGADDEEKRAAARIAYWTSIRAKNRRKRD
jgi:hypothetical protein